MWPAYLTLVAALAATGVGFEQLRTSGEAHDRERFEEGVFATRKAIVDRLTSYVALLDGMRALFYASESVRPVEWRRYLLTLGLPANYPGITHIGYCPRIEAAAVPAHVAGMQKFGFTNYHLWPEGARKEFFPIAYRNLFGPDDLASLGFDFGSDPERAVALAAARDQASPVASGKVRLLLSGATNWSDGFLIVVPLYRERGAARTVQQRRAQLTGYLYGTFEPPRLMRDVLGRDNPAPPHVNLEAYAGPELAEAELLYRLDNRPRPQGSGGPPRFEKVELISSLGQTWALRFYTLPAFEQSSGRWLAHAFLGGGLAVSLLLFASFRVQIVGRVRAERLLRRLGESEAELKVSHEQLVAQMQATQQAHQELAQAHRLAQGVIESSREILVAVDAQRRLQEFNPAAERVFGYMRAEVLHRPLGMLCADPAEGDALAERVERLGQAQERLVGRRQDGRDLFLDVECAWLRDRRDQVAGFMISGRDVTELKEAQDAVARRERYLAALVNVQASILAATGAEAFYATVLGELGRAASASRAYLFENHRDSAGRLRTSQRAEWVAPGITPEIDNPQMQGLPYEALPAEVYDAFVQGRVVNTRAVDVPEPLRGLLEAQKVRSLLNLPVHVRGEFWGFIGFDNCREDRLWDPLEVELLTAAASAVALGLERQAAGRALEDSEQRFRGVFELASDALFLLRPEPPDRLLMVEANRSACAMHGYRREDLTEQPIAQLEAPEGGHLAPDQIRRLLGGETLTFEVLHRRKDGSQFPVEGSARVIRLHGRTFILAVYRDITERKKLEVERLRSSKLESVGVLAGGIAHDFNNVLSGVLGNVSLAKTLAPATGELQQRLSEAEQATLMARDLTQQLLTFSRGGAPIKQTTRLNELIRTSAAFATHGSRVGCRFRIADDLRMVEADAGQLSQVLHNLVLNAVQAMPEGGFVEVAAENQVLLEGDVASLPAGAYVRLEVRDAGVGIAPEHLGKIFDPYFTTKPEGTGLGLATVYSVVRRHEGQIQVDSQPGAGTAFTIYLPASNAPEAPVAPDLATVPTGTGRVLVVDDEPLVRGIASRMLEKLGYQPTAAADGAEGVRLYAEARAHGEPFVAVLMDLTIPGGVGGREAVQRLLALDAQAKVIVSSGYSDDPVMAQHRDYGFRGVVAKPYKLSDLAQTLEAVLKEDEPSRAPPAAAPDWPAKSRRAVPTS